MESEFYCIKCGKRGMLIPRKAGKGREAGHLKRLWCLNCKTEFNHVEVKPYTHYDIEDFELEREYGNFDEEGNRKMKYGLFRDKLHKEGIL